MAIVIMDMSAEQYEELDKGLTYEGRMKEKEQKKMERKRKIERNPLYRVACGLGLA